MSCRPDLRRERETPLNIRDEEASLLLGFLAKAVSRARRGTESLAVSLSLRERDDPPDPGDAPDHPDPDRNLAVRIRTFLRCEDEMVQVDRREFVLVLEGAQAEDAAAVVQHLRGATLRDRPAPGDRARGPRPSFGIVPVNGSHTPGEVLALLEESRSRLGAHEGVDMLLCEFESSRWPGRYFPGHRAWRPSSAS